MSIDRDIAEKVMGYIEGKDLIVGRDAWLRQSSSTSTLRCSVWHPSTDIKQAFEVVEKMDENGFEFTLMKSKTNYRAMFVNQETRKSGNGIHKNPATAISLAALKAMEA